MKTASDEVFNLIKSLKSHEKRLFKQYCKKESDSVSYLNLFDAIDAQEHYDEKKLTAVFNKKKGINNIKGVKSYLLEALFNFLEHHYLDYSVEIQLQRLLQRIEILFSKGLMLSAHKRVLKAEQLATEHHQYPYLLSILQWKRKLNQKVDKKDFTNELKIVDLHKNLVEYQAISADVFNFLITGGRNLTKKEIIAIQNIYQSNQFKSEDAALSFPAKIQYWKAKGNINFILKNWKLSYEDYKQAFNYFELSKLGAVEKIKVLSMQLIALRELKNINEIKLIIAKAQETIYSLPSKKISNDLSNTYLGLMLNYVSYQIKMLNLNEALVTSEGLVEMVDEVAETQGFMLFYYNLFLIYFIQTDYKKALPCATKILHCEKHGIRLDLLSTIKLFYVALHYELGNMEMLNKLSISFYKDFVKSKKDDTFVKLALTFFSKKINEKKLDQVKILFELKTSLEPYKSNNTYNITFTSWLESKIQNKPMIEMLRKNNWEEV